MNEEQAKTLLTEMLDRFTVGSILHLLADVQRDAGEQARLADDAVAYEQSKTVEHALVVVAMGIDAAQPS